VRKLRPRKHRDELKKETPKTSPEGSNVATPPSSTKKKGNNFSDSIITALQNRPITTQKGPGAKGGSIKENSTAKDAGHKEGNAKPASGKDAASKDAGSKDAGSKDAGSKDAGSTAAAPVGAAKLAASLGDIAELQKKLEEDRNRLQLFVIKAKQEHEEKRESKEKYEQRQREYYKAELGEPCGPNNRFLLEEELGKGVFSSVYRGKDMGAQGAQGKEFAIKFIRANPMCRRATEKEVKLMRRLRNQASVSDPEGARCLLSLAGMEMFDHAGHLAVVLPLMRCDLRCGLRKYGQGHGLMLQIVKDYARDIFLALRALRSIKVVHTDLKPDNLLMSLDKASVKLSDFGSAMDVEQAAEVRTDSLQPRFYRAPEVIMGQAYDTQIDIWSAGATLFELATDRMIFRGDSNSGMLHEMLKVCGAFPRNLATTGKFASKHFTADGDFKHCPKGSAEGSEEVIPAGRFPRNPQTLLQLLDDAVRKPDAESAEAAWHKSALRHLADLIGKCIQLDPVERITPKAALTHAFIRGSKGDEASVAKNGPAKKLYATVDLT